MAETVRKTRLRQARSAKRHSPMSHRMPKCGIPRSGELTAAHQRRAVPSELNDVERARLQLEQLEQRIAELENAIRARDDFIAMAIHDLRNPLNTLDLQVQNMLHLTSQDETSCSDDLRQDLERLDQRLKRFGHRANVLLDAVRLYSRNFVLDLERVNLTRVTQDVLSDLEPEFRHACCELYVELEPSISGMWDRVALEQVLINLLSNAVKYGAGSLICVTLKAEPPYALLRVTDHGIGISRAVRKRIFQKFERGVRKSTQDGFGMGLWITGQIIEALHGKIAVKSRVGRGSTFTVRLPRIHQVAGNTSR